MVGLNNNCLAGARVPSCDMQTRPDMIDIDTLDTSKMASVQIFDANAILRGGYLLISDKPDRTGMLSVLDPINKRITRVHPSRVDRSAQAGSMAISGEREVVAACPSCGTLAPSDGKIGKCPACGEFPIIGEFAPTTPREPVPQKKIDEVDLDALAAAGELWIKSGVPFDDGKTEVLVINFLVGSRYLAFNLYNGTFGKRDNKPPIDKLINGEGVGYHTDDVGKWRKRLIKKGYRPFTP